MGNYKQNNNSHIGRRLTSGAFWSLLGEVGVRGLSFASAVIIARWLGAEDFGAFALIQATLATLTIFAIFGMGQTSTRFIAAFRDTEPQRVEAVANLVLKFSFVTGLIIMAGVFIFSPVIAGSAMNAPRLELPLKIVSPVLLFYAITGALTGVILGFEGFRQLARVNWLFAIISFVFVVVGTLLWGLEGAVTGLAVSEAVRTILIFNLSRNMMLNHGFSLFGKSGMTERKILWQFSLPLLLGSSVSTPVLWGCQTIIAQQPEGLAQIGIYNAGQKWMTLVNMIPMAASAALIPILSNLGSTAGTATVKKTTLSVAKVQLALSVLPALGVALLAPRAAQLFGADFTSASVVIVVMMILAPIYVLKHLYWQALTSGGHTWAAFWLQMLWAIIALALALHWKESGAFGLAKSMVIAYGVALLVNVILIERIWRRSD